jgi:protein SCO1/2
MYTMLRKSLLYYATTIAPLLLAAMAVAYAFDGSRWGADYFPNVELTTQDGKTVHFFDDLLKDKVVVIDLIYTHCVDNCPLETARLADVQRRLGDRVGKDIFFYSITIDPKRDTPKVLKAYAEKYHAGPGWLFLTGKADDITLISKKLGLYSDPDPNNRDGHTPGLLMGNQKTGEWRQGSAGDNVSFLTQEIGDLLPHVYQPAQLAHNKVEGQPLHFDKGRYLFNARCAACHTIGHGDKIGPDLFGVAGVRGRAWLTRFIQNPDRVLAEGDPIATALYRKYKGVVMPNLRMTDDETSAVIGFLKSQQQSADASANHTQPTIR